MAPRDIASLVASNASRLRAGERASNAMTLFGPPQYMGSSLDDLRSPESAAMPMPGIAMGSRNAKQAEGALLDSGEIKTQPIAEDEPRSQQYYVGYGADDNKVLWLHVKVNPDGDEIITDHGWKNM
ncbi:hypothetical protein GGI20_002557 [Coemansia sp. BCRC 34301]|nr:hypothetical protein GGI20_002557 [Coemansia sp. BCRC 34301]